MGNKLEYRIMVERSIRRTRNRLLTVLSILGVAICILMELS